jgi:Cu/Ag efflux protein CusF
LAIALALVAGVAVPFAPALSASAQAAETYSARGVVKSFGPDRAYVNIAHEDIPGYMRAMTMSFEPRDRAQLKDLAPGDAVAFEFADLGDGKRVLLRIGKR